MKYYIFEDTYFWADENTQIPKDSTEITKETFDSYHSDKLAAKNDYLGREAAKSALLESMLNDQLDKLKTNPSDESVAQAVKDYVISV